MAGTLARWRRAVLEVAGTLGIVFTLLVMLLDGRLRRALGLKPPRDDVGLTVTFLLVLGLVHSGSSARDRGLRR